MWLGNLMELVYLEEATVDHQTFILIRPRQYLGDENFRAIAGIVREHGGEYVSAGKESHFRILKEEATTQPAKPDKVGKLTQTKLIQEIQEIMLKYQRDIAVWLDKVAKVQREG